MSAERASLYLIDGSSYIYRAFHALPPLTSPQGVPTQAIYGFATMLMKLLKDAKPAYIAVVFDAPGPTFRDDLYDAYKAHRPPAPDDLKVQIPRIHQLVDAFRICTLMQEGVEADDVIATIVHRYADDHPCVIVSSDKDLMQLVGPTVTLWDTMRDRRIDAEAVREKFGVAPERVVDVMALVGDASDNVPGVKGIGAKTAAALIDHFGSLDELLDRVEEVSSLGLRGAAKVAEKLRDGAETARLSRQLVALRTDVPLALDIDAMTARDPDVAALRRMFAELGFQSLSDQMGQVPAPPAPPVVQVSGGQAIGALDAAVGGGGRVAIAALTSAGPVVTTPASALVFAAGDGATEVALDDGEVRAAVAKSLAAAGARLVMYDGKRIDHALAASGIEMPAAGVDVMVAAYLVDPSAANDLASVIAAGGGSAAPTGFGEDAAATGAALVEMASCADDLVHRLADLGMARLFDEVESPLVHVLARIERRGLALDTQRLEQMGEEFAGRLEELMQAIHELAGHPFNIHSPQQLRQVLFDEIGLSTRGLKKGKTGYSTDVDVLTKLSADHPLPAKILEYRALSKLKSTYIDALPPLINSATGRLHTSLHQTVAATGRLSSSDPNLQNIPIRGEEGRRIREAFVAPRGRVLVAADYSQIELRVLAHLSHDPVLCEAFRNGEDIHARTAAEVFGVLPGTVTSDMRRAAKVINFGILYGMGPQRLARDLGISLSQAKDYIDNYFARYSGVRGYLDKVLATARETGFVSTILGRRRPVPELRGGQRGLVQAAERMAVNTPLQGSAADIIKLAMLRLDRRLAEEGVDGFMILQVHDELLFEAASGDGDLVAALAREEMAAAVELSVPLVVDVGIGRSWAEAH